MVGHLREFRPSRRWDLRLSVRDRLRRGILVPAPSQVWAGMETGSICTICGKVISPDEVENEVVVDIWRSESYAREAGHGEENESA